MKFHAPPHPMAQASMLTALHPSLLTPPISVHNNGLTDGLLLTQSRCVSQPTWLQSAQRNKNKWSDKMTRQALAQD